MGPVLSCVRCNSAGHVLVGCCFDARPSLFPPTTNPKCSIYQRKVTGRSMYSLLIYVHRYCSILDITEIRVTMLYICKREESTTTYPNSRMDGCRRCSDTTCPPFRCGHHALDFRSIFYPTKLPFQGSPISPFSACVV